MNSKKSQIQMMETIMVLIIFFIIVVLGLMFYFRILNENNLEAQEKLKEHSSIEVAQLASTLPELQCFEDKSNCIDILKLEAYSELLTVEDFASYYFDYFGYSNITVQQIFPFGVEKEWQLYLNKPDNFNKSRLTTFFPIVLYNASADVNYFGFINIEVYK
jgi:hypothetical protein